MCFVILIYIREGLDAVMIYGFENDGSFCVLRGRGMNFVCVIDMGYEFRLSFLAYTFLVVNLQVIRDSRKKMCRVSLLFC